MAKGRKTGGRDFVKGHSMPGPGRPKIVPGLEGVERLDRDTLNRQIASMWDKPIDELRAIINSKSETMGNIVIASIIAKAASQGDANRMTALLSWLFPKQSEIKLQGQLSLEEVISKAVEAKEE